VRSIFQQVTDSANSVTGMVYSSGLPYAAIQEFGGWTKAHAIEAKKGKALACKRRVEGSGCTPAFLLFGLREQRRFV
jgi:hypothetical protein